MGSTSVVRARADWVRILESALVDEPDDQAWGETVAEALRGVFTRARFVGIQIVKMEEHGALSAALLVAPAALREIEGMLEFPREMPPEIAHAFYYPPVPVTTHSEILRSLSDSNAQFTREFNRARGFSDTLGIISHPTPAHTLVAFAIHDREVVLSTHERRLLTQVALHLESGYRVRRCPSVVKAVLSEDGRVLERTADAPPSALLEAHVARVNAARANDRRGAADAMDLWPALLAGKLSLVPRGTRSKRHYEIIDNPAASVALRALSVPERQVLEQSSRGLSTKLVGYALGLSSGAVSARLAQAATKLGVASRLELLRVAALFAGDPRARVSDAELSEAERDVLHLLERGLSNSEIARLRSRSARTIANQVASLLRKTRSSSRRELVVRSASQ
jgi:DNA-binding NarL/FixJ family response regulator